MEIKQKAASTITDKGTGFQVIDKDRAYDFEIKGLKLGTLISISEESSKLTSFDKATKVEVIKSMKKDTEIKARIVAIAVVNSKKLRWRIGKSKVKELTDFFIYKLDSNQLNKIVDLIIDKMGINDFFASTVSLKGIDLVERKMSGTGTGQPSQSGEE